VIVERDGTAGVDEAFLALPHQLYREDRRWIPEEPAAVERAFSPANRWHDGRRARTFVVPGRARAAAFFDPSFTVDGTAAAFFGYFETNGDRDADGTLFGRIADWARGQGATRLYGPINFTTALGYRVLLDAERDAVPFAGEPYNPPWYGPELQSLGFALERRYLTQTLDRALVAATVDRHQPLLLRLGKRGYRFATIGDDEWLARLPELHTLADSIFAGNFAYAPMPFSEFAAAFGTRLLRRRWRELSLIAHAPDGALAGFCLVYPHLDGRVAILKTIAVNPKYRARGVAEAMAVFTLERALTACDEVWGALIREDNASRRLAPVETPALRWYGLYAKSL
jgi:ribosomal protein S18 acetylase RimI-like enzyme